MKTLILSLMAMIISVQSYANDEEVIYCSNPDYAVFAVLTTDLLKVTILDSSDTVELRLVKRQRFETYPAQTVFSYADKSERSKSAFKFTVENMRAQLYTLNEYREVIKVEMECFFTAAN